MSETPDKRVIKTKRAILDAFEQLSGWVASGSVSTYADILSNWGVTTN